MTKNRNRFVPGLSLAEGGLERRIALSGMQAEVSALVARRAATRTTLAISAGTLNQPVTFTATVRAAGAAPTGTVRIMDRGRLLGTIALTPAGTGGRLAASTGSLVLEQPAGGASYYFGRHRVTAMFVPSGRFARSNAAGSFAIAQPAYTELANGVKVATIGAGSGPQVQAGQTAGLLYTGYLAGNGRIFDASALHGGQPLSFRVGSGQVIPGFDAGTVGMRLGETRLILIPPSQGYGSTANGPIPANSTLIFAVRLVAIA